MGLLLQGCIRDKEQIELGRSDSYHEGRQYPDHEGGVGEFIGALRFVEDCDQEECQAEACDDGCAAGGIDQSGDDESNGSHAQGDSPGEEGLFAESFNEQSGTGRRDD